MSRIPSAEPLRLEARSFGAPQRVAEFAEPDMIGPEGLWAAAGYSRHADLQPPPSSVHVHARLEVGLVLTGEEEIQYADFVAACRPGDVWLCSSWEPHGFRYTRPKTANVVARFPPDFLGNELLAGRSWLTLLVVPPAERPRVTSAELRTRVLEIGRCMRREIEARPPYWETMVRLDLLRLLAELSRNWQPPEVMRHYGQAPFVGMAQIMPALNLVHSLPWRKMEVKEAARSCGLGVSSFRRVFRETLGLSFGQFGLRARLAFAAHSLLNSGRTVAAIAQEAGFVDDSHLRHWFRKHYGCSPTEYRRRFGQPGGLRGSPQ